MTELGKWPDVEVDSWSNRKGEGEGLQLSRTTTARFFFDGAFF